MGIGDAIAGATNRFYGAIRHPEALKAVDGERAEDLSGLEGHRYALLTTYKRSGEPVPTPVWFGIADGKLYASSEAKVWKVKRIRNNPRVLVGPCSARGKPLGPMVEGAARVIPGDGSEEAERAERAVQSNYGVGRKLYEGAGEAMKVEEVYLEVTPV